MKIPPIPYYAPSGTPIRALDLITLLSATITKTDRIEELADSIREKFGVKHCFFVSTGRAAMAMLLSVLKEISSDAARKRVVLPAYTCYSVPASVARANLNVDVVDVDHESLSYNQERLINIDTDKCLAVLSANLYGIPNNLPFIETFSQQNGLYFVDDAAQSMGSSICNRYAGTFGDAGLYSLDKGKNITSIQGGIIVTSNEEIANRLNKRMQSLKSQPATTSLKDSVKLILYAIFLHPYLYWIPASTPSLDLGKTIYTTEYPIEQYSKALSNIAYRLFCRLASISKARIDNARYMLDGIKSNASVRSQTLLPNCTPVYLRLPIFIDDAARRRQLVERLNSAGISATTSYPQSIADLQEVNALIESTPRPADGGRRVAESIVTIPTHAYMTRKSMDNILNIIEAVSEH